MMRNMYSSGLRINRDDPHVAPTELVVLLAWFSINMTLLAEFRRPFPHAAFLAALSFIAEIYDDY